ncbi:nitroreductase family deazaflavin-dependent oxidoreductase [Yinghuangia aomiensis]|uniref:Nitroreductase family deazaflavin-dependent oxidoreductase n=1 Tax=Yinghuangia aomiensis TaxID=676205 RepID=A0ABP9HV50_9ACTN
MHSTLSPRQRIRNRLITTLHRCGLAVGPTQLLTVAGRRSGVPRTTPVAPVAMDGSLYIVQAYPGSAWVRNARAAGTGSLARGRHTRQVTLVELPVSERARVLRQFPVQNPRGVGAFVRNGLVATGTPDEFAEAAHRCPVFLAAPSGDRP